MCIFRYCVTIYCTTKNNISYRFKKTLFAQQITTKKYDKKVFLSLEGGALKGMIQLKILAKLDAVIRSTDNTKCFMDFIDVVGGVSIGSVIATALLLKDESGGYKYSISDCIEMLNTFPEKFFEKNWMLFFQPVLKGDKALEGFKELFGKESTFNDLVDDKKLLILSTNLDTCKNTIWTNLVDSESWKKNFENDSSLKAIRYVDVNDVKLYDAVNSSSSYLMALPAHEVKYKLLSENEAKNCTEADGCYINVTPHLDLLSTLSAT